MPTEIVLPSDHPMMVAWNKFESTDEFKNALRWAVETKYDDGRPVGDIQREQHAKGAMWLAFTRHFLDEADSPLHPSPELLRKIADAMDSHYTCEEVIKWLDQMKQIREVKP